MRCRTICSAVAVAALVAACSDADDAGVFFDDPAPTTSVAPVTDAARTTASTGPPATVAAAPGAVTIDLGREVGPISPLIRGLSGGLDRDALRDLGATLNSWGGNPATRYNYQIGHAWNTGADWEYRNGNYGQTGDAARDFIAESTAGGAVVRLAVPTLGWVAKDDNTDTCSFPSDDGCTGGAGLSCDNPGAVADPRRANVTSTPDMVADWIARLQAAGYGAPYIAMDNEPELWGHSHYDVHPSCTTYEEVLDRYLAHAGAVRSVAPDAQLLGPVACCWFDYWETAPGPAGGPDAEYLPWFLEHVRQHDERVGARSIHFLDVHYYPQGDVYNEATDADTAARRLRSTRSLWDPSYVDESWIDAPIEFIPRMRRTIDASYPGTGLAISEWNFGADTTMNGALVIADVLGIYGRYGVDLAAYWRHPPVGSPGWYAFKMHGNYDDRGSSFSGTALDVGNADIDRLAIYAALDRAGGRLRVLLVNKTSDETISLPLAIEGGMLDHSGRATAYRYVEATPDRIVQEQLATGSTPLSIDLPASSITLVDLPLTA